LLVKAAWDAEIIDQATIMNGIHLFLYQDGDRSGEARNLPVRSKLFGDESRWKFSAQKRHQEDGLSIVEVIGIHPQLGKHLITDC